MNPSIVIWSIVSALAGFLFGFDTVVISGAEKTIQNLWQLSPGLHGVAMAAALYGTVVGAMFGGWPTDRWGRRPTLFWIGILYFVSAVWSGLATDVWSFIIARFIGGLGVNYLRGDGTRLKGNAIIEALNRELGLGQAQA